MDQRYNRIERRRAPRVKRQIPLKIKIDDYDAVGLTRDLSCIGAYCTINKYIAPFKIISVIFLLPLKMNHRSIVCNVRCRGVIVRAEKNSHNNQEYNVAIYFNRLKQSDKAKLSQYVKQYL